MSKREDFHICNPSITKTLLTEHELYIDKYRLTITLTMYVFFKLLFMNISKLYKYKSHSKVICT